MLISMLVMDFYINILCLFPLQLHFSSCNFSVINSTRLAIKKAPLYYLITLHEDLYVIVEIIRGTILHTKKETDL